MLDLDHIMILSPENGAETDLFRKAGFTSIISGTHKKQGTSGNYIFFLNFYIEILYISDNELAESQFIKFSQNFKERFNWKHNNSSPFGIGLNSDSDYKKTIPFSYKEYKADWFSGDGILLSDDNKKCSSPLVFVVPPKMVFPKYSTMKEMLDSDNPVDFKENHIHKNLTEKLTAFKITTPEKQQTKTIKELIKSEFNFEFGNKHLVELEFDFYKNRKTIDMSPHLPIIIKY